MKTATVAIIIEKTSTLSRDWKVAAVRVAAVRAAAVRVVVAVGAILAAAVAAEAILVAVVAAVAVLAAVGRRRLVRLMNNPNARIPEEMAGEVMEVAARLYAETTNSYSTGELVEAGSEVQIPPAIIEQAIAQVQEKRRQERLRQQKARDRNKIALFAAGGVAALVLLWGGLTYNSLQNASSEVEAAWAQVENQLQRRADLIPQLVNVTKASAQQEKDLINLLVRSRETYLQADTPVEKQQATTQINAAIAQFQARVANIPQLQSSQAFTNLQYEIAGTENRIATERRRYNQAVQAYNSSVRAFPNALVSGLFGFEPQPFFQAQSTEVPNVEF